MRWGFSQALRQGTDVAAMFMQLVPKRGQALQGAVGNKGPSSSYRLLSEGQHLLPVGSQHRMLSYEALIQD